MHSGVLVISVSFPGILAFGMCVGAWLEVEARESEAWEMDFEKCSRRGLGIDTPIGRIDTNCLRRGKLKSRRSCIDTLLRGIDTECLRPVKRSTQEVRYRYPLKPYRYRAATDDKTKAF